MIKRLSAMFLCLIMALALLPTTAFAAKSETFTVLSTDATPVTVTVMVLTDPLDSIPGTVQVGNGTAKAILGEEGSVTSVTLPEVITGSEGSYRVTKVGSCAFDQCSALQSVSLPGVTVIGGNAFHDCTSLQSVTLPEVQTIGADAFSNCSSLTTLNLPYVQTIDSEAFHMCTSLQSVTLPEVQTIGSNAFDGCSNLTTLNLPKVQTIGNSAFAGCTSLQSVTIWQTSAPSLGNDTVFDGVKSDCALYIPNGASDNYTGDSYWYFSSIYRLCPVTGTVYDADGNATADATVSVYGISTKTDSSGTYTVYVKQGDITTYITAHIEGAGETSISVGSVYSALSDQHIYFGKAAAPTFTPAAGTYTGTKSVAITCDTPGAKIYYTDNGSEPTASSTLYSAPISVSSSTTLKAKAFKSGLEASNTASATYTITDNETSVFIWGKELTSTTPYYHNGVNGAQGDVDNIAENYNAYFNAANGTLTLKNINVVDCYEVADCGTFSILYGIVANGNIGIILEGDNFVSTAYTTVSGTPQSNYAAVYAHNGSLVINGSGTLTATAGPNWSDISESSGVRTDNAFTLESGTLTAIARSGGLGCGVMSSTSTITVNGGTLTATGGENGTTSVGVWADKGLTVNGGTLTATGRTSSFSSIGVYAYNVLIKMTGGRLVAKTDSPNEDKCAIDVHESMGLPNIYCWRTASDDDYTFGSSSQYDWKATDTYVEILCSTTPPSVMVNPTTVSIDKGGSKTFEAIVLGENSPAQTVTWSVSGGVTGTSISSSGVLTIAANETAATLTVKATSTVDAEKFGTATVTVTTPAPTVTSVAVNPASASIQKGGTKTFAATVTGTNSPAQTVTWTVEGGVTGTGISSSGVLTIAANETAATLTVKATSTVDTEKFGTATVTVTTPAPNPEPSDSDGGSSDYTPASVTVYNDPVQPKATVWLSGNGLAANDQLITKPNPQAPAFSVMRTVAGKNEVVATYDISLQSGKKSTGSAMSLTFDIGTKHSGQEFTLVHQKADGTLEYFYAVADSSGKLVFNGIHSLSPFMIVKGRLAQTAYTNLTDLPKTGDNATSSLHLSIVLIACAGLTAGLAFVRRKRQNGQN